MLDLFVLAVFPFSWVAHFCVHGKSAVFHGASAPITPRVVKSCSFRIPFMPHVVRLIVEARPDRKHQQFCALDTQEFSRFPRGALIPKEGSRAQRSLIRNYRKIFIPLYISCGFCFMSECNDIRKRLILPMIT